MQADAMALGFAVVGEVPRGGLLSKGGMGEGMALVLTKALGTGVLFAGEMRGQCEGRWLGTAMSSMLRLNGDALAIARRHKAAACTDVTGFG